MYFPSKSMWTFLAITGISVTQNAFMLYFSNNYGNLLQNNQVTLSSNGTLGGLWGDLIFAFSIVTIVACCVLFYFVFSKWRQSGGPLRAVFSLILSTAIISAASGSWNLFLTQKFVSEQANGNFGATCPALGPCNVLGGHDGSVTWGLNVASITAFSAAMMQYFVVSG